MSHDSTDNNYNKTGVHTFDISRPFRKSCFSHCQFYIAASRASFANCLRVLSSNNKTYFN